MKYSPIPLESLQKRCILEEFVADRGTQQNLPSSSEAEASQRTSVFPPPPCLWKISPQILHIWQSLPLLQARKHEMFPRHFLFHICLQKPSPSLADATKAMRGYQTKTRDRLGRGSCANPTKHFQTLQWKEQDRAVLELQRSLLESNTAGKLKVSFL